MSGNAAPIRARVLDYLRRYYARHGVMPSFKDIEFELGVDRGQAYNTVNALAATGQYLKRVKAPHRPIPFELVELRVGGAA